MCDDVNTRRRGPQRLREWLAWVILVVKLLLTLDE